MSRSADSFMPELSLRRGEIFGKERQHLRRETGGDAVSMVAFIGLELVRDSSDA